MAKTRLLGSRGQKILKIFHIVFVTFCLGGLLSIFLLILLKQPISRDQNPFLFDLSIYKLFNVVVNNSFYGIIITAILYGLFTNWGFFKHRWITVKWLGVLILFAFVWIWVGPTINGMVSLADGGFIMPGTQSEYLSYNSHSQLYILIEGILFLTLLVISVIKPWGTWKHQFKVKRGIVLTIVATLVVLMAAIFVMNSIVLHHYRTMKINDSDLSSLADGIYQGKASIGGFTYEAKVQVNDHKIIDLEFSKNRKSSYARFAEGIIPRIIDKQTANVDVITGATTTSKALMKTVENALLNK